MIWVFWEMWEMMIFLVFIGFTGSLVYVEDVKYVCNFRYEEYEKQAIQCM